MSVIGSKHYNNVIQQLVPRLFRTDGDVIALVASVMTLVFADVGSLL